IFRRRRRPRRLARHGRTPDAERPRRAGRTGRHQLRSRYSAYLSSLRGTGPKQQEGNSVMSKWFRENAPISARELTDEFQRLRRGSVTRRHFLGVTGLGLAAAVLARQPGLFNSAAYAQQEDLGSAMSIATWPNYHDPATFEAFTAETGVAVEVNVFGSNEE